MALSQEEVLLSRYYSNNDSIDTFNSSSTTAINSSSHDSETGYDYRFTVSIATSVLLGIMTLTTIIGNIILMYLSGRYGCVYIYIYYMSLQYRNKSKSQLTSHTPAQLPAVASSAGHIVYIYIYMCILFVYCLCIVCITVLYWV
jgi:hypothetical protein